MGAMGQSCGRAWLLCMAEGQRFAGGGEAALPPESMRRSGGGLLVSRRQRVRWG